MNHIRSRIGLAASLSAALLIPLALLVTTVAQPQTPPATITLCVNDNPPPGGSGDGSSWANAMTSLDTALAAAPPNAHIWVAEGSYMPLSIANGFQITKPLKLYGGFFGDEASISARHGSFQATILEGDAGQPVVYTDNVNHLVSIESIDAEGDAAAVVIDGFRITNGFCILTPPNPNGAGILAHCSDLDVVNCFFDHNYATDGGAIGFVSGCPTVPVPPLQDPSMTSILRVETCEFFDNHADARGGAIFAERARGWVFNSSFIQNLGNAAGGGAFVWRTRTDYRLDFANCVFWENYCTSPIVGGGALAFGEASAGPGESGRSEVVNCTLAGNFVSNQGQAACVPGQAFAVSANSVVGLYNSILWGNHDLCQGYCNAPVAHPITGSPIVEYSCVQYGWSGTGANNISGPPDFQLGNNLATTFGVGCVPDPTPSLPLFTLRRASSTVAGSDCIDNANHDRLPADFGDLDDDGDTAEKLPLDFLESARAVDRHGLNEDNLGAPAGGTDYMDMGAYERP